MKAKVYIVSGIDGGGVGFINAYSSLQKAKKARHELKKVMNQVFPIDTKEFEISKDGILYAIEYGAYSVYK